MSIYQNIKNRVLLKTIVMYLFLIIGSPLVIYGILIPVNYFYLQELSLLKVNNHFNVFLMTFVTIFIGLGLIYFAISSKNEAKKLKDKYLLTKEQEKELTELFSS